MTRTIWLFVLILVSLQNCGQHTADGTSHQSIPELEAAYEVARNTKNIRSLLVSQNGKLIAEEYFASFFSDSLEHVRSVTKSVIATLIGIAIDKGIIGGVNDSITKYLDKSAEGKEAITIKHLMSMTSGLEWREVMGNMEIDQWINSENPMKYVLDKPIEFEPGTQWEYSTGIIHLLSAILTNASGMSTLEFAKQHLFTPLGIGDVKWKLLNDGYYHGGSRLQIKPKDMMKFGQLYANGGMFEGQQIVSKSFIEEATYLHEPGAVPEEGKGYGYGWWTGQDNGFKIFFASGYGGQTIIVLPDHNIVVVTTFKWKVSNQMAADQQTVALRVGGSVLKALLIK